MPIINVKAPDLVMKALGMDDELCERLRPAGLPPLDGDSPNILAMQTMLAQQSQLIQQLTQSVHALSDKKELERMKLESAERRNADDNQTKLIVAETVNNKTLAATNSENARHQLTEELAFLAQRFAQLHASELQAQQLDHQATQAAMDRQQPQPATQ